ncbi:MAG: pectate lyase [Spirochaetaceae bacterium]|nr:MAG: pectate lyase [Spirochaetaceae bacterium]
MKRLFVFIVAAAVIAGCTTTSTTGTAQTPQLAPQPSPTPQATPTPVKPAVVAFPGADGMGKYTVGGRGGKVIEVTTLEDDVPGSLRAAIEAKGPRIVVFRVSGIIELKYPLLVVEPYITIAGQTAPGDGICLKNFVVRIMADQVIIRFIRVRLGIDSKQESDCIDISKGKNIILDHISSSWSVDETLSVSFQPMVDYLTVQWCFITESLNQSLHAKGDHGYGSLIRGGNGARYTYHHNLYAHHRARNPRPGNYANYQKDPIGLFFEFSNNVVYNYGGEYAGYNQDKDSVTYCNFIGNYYISGPNSVKGAAFAYREYSSRAASYFNDNYINGKKPDDPWAVLQFDSSYNGDRNAYKKASPIPMEYPVAVQDGSAAFQKILLYGGASLPKRDTVDERITREIQGKTGRIINDPSDVGGYPEYKSSPVPVDTDHDGMPDAWEKTNGLDPAKDDSAGLKDKDGYTNIEQYLNSLVTIPL